VGVINSSKLLISKLHRKQSSRRLRCTQEKGVAEKMLCFYGIWRLKIKIIHFGLSLLQLQGWEPSNVTYTCNTLFYICPLHVSALRPSSEGRLTSTWKETLYILPLVEPHLQYLILSLHVNVTGVLWSYSAFTCECYGCALESFWVTNILHMLKLIWIKSLLKSLCCVSWGRHDCHFTFLTYHWRLLNW
jgi:hypothetical protein